MSSISAAGGTIPVQSLKTKASSAGEVTMMGKLMSPNLSSNLASIVGTKSSDSGA